MALKSIYAQRLKDLQDMLDFNARETPACGGAAARIRRPWAESQARGDDP
jgi:hypothetical protein